jgi:hypothetical protein
VLDTTAVSAAAALAMLDTGSAAVSEKMFATTDDWFVFNLPAPLLHLSHPLPALCPPCLKHRTRSETWAFFPLGFLLWLRWVADSPDPAFRSEIETPADVAMYRITLGIIGQSGPAQDIVTENIRSYIPYLETYVEEGKLRPMDCEIVGDGFEALSEAIKLSGSGKYGGKKCVVKLA